MEVALGVEVGERLPAVVVHIVHLALVHRFVRERGTDRINKRLVLVDRYRGQCVRASFKQHVFPLHQSLLHELKRVLRCLTWLTSTRKENPSFFCFYGHEVRWDFYVDDVRTV